MKDAGIAGIVELHVVDRQPSAASSAAKWRIAERISAIFCL